MDNPLFEKDIYKKIQKMEDCCHQLLMGQGCFIVPELPARNLTVVEPSQMPPKKGFSLAEGRAHMLHDLASIELQAAELGIRTLIEFPNADPLFREQLAEIVLEENLHLRLCLQGLEKLGFQWGDWPVQIKLWLSTSSEDDLLDRILIVHRYLEGAGLDASTTLMRRLSGVNCSALSKAIHKIANDEEAHVEFGSFWFKKICDDQNQDSDTEFVNRFNKLLPRLPKRLEKLNEPLRKKVGFSNKEIQLLKQTRQHWIEWGSRI